MLADCLLWHYRGFHHYFITSGHSDVSRDLTTEQGDIIHRSETD